LPHLLGIAIGILSLGAQDPTTPVRQDPPTSPPIFQPGAPGQPTRTVTAEQAAELARTTYTDADVRFMQHMIVHHAQAVEMARLLEVRGHSPQVKALGRRIAIGQASEMDLMRGWLQARGQPVEARDLHAGHAASPSETALMPGMLSPAQMARLAAAEGAEFDRLFLEGMIQHHQGALDMVEELLALPDSAEDTLLSDFATSVVADQSSEILRMRSLLAEL
jgi:uncharacterized protein (DUF305 family)